MASLESIREKSARVNEQIIQNLDGWEPKSEDLQMFIRSSQDMVKNPLAARKNLQGMFLDVMLSSEVIDLNHEISKEVAQLSREDYEVHLRESMELQEDVANKMNEVLTRVITEAFQNNLLAGLGGLRG
jgi:hypothetical protein